MEVDDKISPQNSPQSFFRREGTFDVPVNNNNNNSPGLHRLRYQLASEGCPESQTSLAKSLLREHTENTNEKKENDELAIRWLLMAADEGAHHEALNLLRECYMLGIGITPANRVRVEKCLNSSMEEKIAQYVGQSLFRQMTFDIKESIPLHYFKLKIDSFLSGNEINSEELTDNGITQNRSISVDQVVTSIHQCLIGKAPDIFIASAIPGKPKTKNKAVNFVAIKGIEILVCIENLLRFLSDVAVIHSVLIVGVVAALFLMILPTILVDQANSFIVNATNAWMSCASYVVMVFSSAKILYRHQVHDNISKWIKVVEKFDVKLKTPRVTNFKSPELNLFALQIISSFFFFTFTEEAGNWIVNRHLLFLSLLSFLAVKPKKLAKILYFAHFSIAILKFHILPMIFPHWKEFYAFPIKISENIQLNISLLAVLGILLIVLHLLVIGKSTAKEYLLNLSGILWINIFTGALSSVTISSLTSDLTFMVLLFMGSNKMAQFTTYSSFLAAESAMSLTMTGSAFGIGTFIFIILSTKARYFQAKFESRKIIAFCLLFLCLSTLYLTSNNKRFAQKPTKEISWSEYALECHHPAWQESNMAKVQMRCDKYQGYKMSVIGSIGYVKRIKKENPVESMIYAFSQTTQSSLRFIFEEDIVSIAVNKLSSCCLQKWTANQYEIKVQIKGTFRVEAELILLVTDICDQFALKLHDNDDVKITGMFLDKMGTDHPVLSLLQGKCLSCIEKVHCNMDKVPKETPSSKKQISVMNINHFFLEPFGLFLI